METRTEVKLFKVDYKCPRCDKGHLRHTGKVLMSSPAKYPHECNNPDCDYAETFTGISYPYNEQVDCETTVELTEDQRLQELCDAMNYNNFCARATLYPGLGIDEIPTITIEDLKK